jgi:hypothetical protein
MTTKPKIYVASKKIPRAREVMKMIREAGYEITFDWATDYHEDNWDEYAQKEREGIQKCDIFVYLWCEDAKSARYEAGMAMGLNKLVIASEAPDSFFYHLPNVVRIQSDSEIVNTIVKNQ